MPDTEKKHKIELTDTELLTIWDALPTGLWPLGLMPEVLSAQARVRCVDEFGLTSGQAGVVVDVMEHARKEGKLCHSNKSADYCGCCGKSAERFQKRRNSSKWHTRYFRAVDFSASMVSIRGHISKGACADCMEAIYPALRSVLKDIQIQMPPHLVEILQIDSFHRIQHYECKCGWTGPETDMRVERTLFQDGWYASGCPQCDLSNSGFGRLNLKRADGFTMMPVEERYHYFGKLCTLAICGSTHHASQEDCPGWRPKALPVPQ